MTSMRLLLTFITFSAAMSAQAPAFEVASVKPAVAPDRPQMMFCIIPCWPGERMGIQGSRVEIRFMSLSNLIGAAYRLKQFQLSGPEWMQAQRFDINAKIPEGASKDQVPEMLQSLLAERFGLALHGESRELAVAALVVAKNGPKLPPAAPNADAPIPEAVGDQPAYSGQGDARKLKDGGMLITGGALGTVRSQHGPNGLRVDFSNLTMEGLADVIAPHVDKPVVNMTNLKGSYSLYWEDTGPTNSGPGGDGRKGTAGPSDGGRAGADPDGAVRHDPMADAIFAALDRYGLRLESRKAPVRIFVVDHIERTPRAN